MNKPTQTLRQFVKEWVSANCNDGEDRSQAEGDRHCYNGPQLYAEFDELARAIEERALQIPVVHAESYCDNGMIFPPEAIKEAIAKAEGEKS